MNKEETKAMLEAMEKDANKKASNFWQPEEGENVIRFLPPVKANDEILPYFHHKVHWIDGKPYECLAQSLVDKDGNYHEAEPCPICKISKKFYKLGERDSEEREIAYTISARDRYIFRIVARGKENETEPEFFEVGPSIYKKFYSVLKSGRYGNIVHPFEGRDFIIDKQGTGRRTNYDNSTPDPNVTPIFEDKDDVRTVLTAIKEMPYSQLVDFTDAETMKEAVEEYLDAEDIADMIGESKKASKPKVEKPAEKTAPKKSSKKEETKEEEEVSTDEVDDILAEFM